MSLGPWLNSTLQKENNQSGASAANANIDRAPPIRARKSGTPVGGFRPTFWCAHHWRSVIGVPSTLDHFPVRDTIPDEISISNNHFKRTITSARFHKNSGTVPEFFHCVLVAMNRDRSICLPLPISLPGVLVPFVRTSFCLRVWVSFAGGHSACGVTQEPALPRDCKPTIRAYGECFFVARRCDNTRSKSSRASGPRSDTRPRWRPRVRFGGEKIPSVTSCRLRRTTRDRLS